MGYEYGRKGEKKVVRSMEKSGWKTRLSPGSRSPCDIVATKPGRKLCIQVKRTRKYKQPELSPNAASRLKAKATRMHAIPVLATVRRGKISLKSVRSKKKIKMK